MTRHALPLEFSFAGFNFPHYIATLPEPLSYGFAHASSIEYMWAARTAALKTILREHQRISGTYHAPNPNRRTREWGFYLEESNACGLRIIDSECGSYTSRESDTTFNGLVARLPKSRGYLAGWTMGVGMASSLDTHVFDNLSDAERAADNLAESAMWEDDQYQRNENARVELEGQIEDKVRAFKECREHVQVLIAARNVSRNAAVTARRNQKITEVRHEAHYLATYIRELHSRMADNFARTGV